jgi:hypothetical protein
MTEARKFYKFRPLKNKTISLILNSAIYFARADQFNDPFDCRLRFAYDLIPDEWRTFLLEHLLKQRPHLTEQEILEMVRKRMEEKFYENSLFLDFLYDMVWAQHLPNVGILSLAGNCTNILLWAHYADSHKECCLEFSSTTDRIFANTQQVKYHEEYPKLDFKKCLQNPAAFGRGHDSEQIKSLVL